LVELTIIAGNDFTEPHMAGGLRYELGLDGKRMKSFANWVKHYKRVTHHWAMYKAMVI